MKRSDVPTMMILVAAETYTTFKNLNWDLPTFLERIEGIPFKVGMRAIERDIATGLLDSGVTDRRPFLTAAGRRWLFENCRADADPAKPFCPDCPRDTRDNVNHAP